MVSSSAAQLLGGRRWRGAELAAQRLLEPLELAKGRAAVAAFGVGTGQREVGLLVGGVVHEELLPAPGPAEQVELQAVTASLGLSVHGS